MAVVGRGLDTEPPRHKAGTLLKDEVGRTKDARKGSRETAPKDEVGRAKDKARRKEGRGEGESDLRFAVCNLISDTACLCDLVVGSHVGFRGGAAVRACSRQRPFGSLRVDFGAGQGV
jgi:hypothetical protein